LGQTYQDCQSIGRKNTSHTPKNKKNEYISKPIEKQKNNITETSPYIPRAAFVEATCSCVRMSGLRNTGGPFTVTIRNWKVRRDGGILARHIGVQLGWTTTLPPEQFAIRRYHLTKITSS
jgi:hypothetical protein